jgi:hypothetical protein
MLKLPINFLFNSDCAGVKLCSFPASHTLVLIERLAGKKLKITITLKDRQTDKQTGRHTDGWTYDRQTERKTEKQTV